MSDGLMDMMKNLFNCNEEMEPICPLSKEDQTEWDNIIALRQEAKDLMEEACARKELFWIKIKRSLPENERNRPCYKIENGMVTGSKSDSCPNHNDS